MASERKLRPNSDEPAPPITSSELRVAALQYLTSLEALASDQQMLVESMGKGDLGVLGPPPAPAAVVERKGGSILDVEGMLWCEDIWNEDREKEAVKATSEQGESLWPSMAAKYEREAKRSWDMFYKRNGTKFFKVCSPTRRTSLKSSLSASLALHTSRTATIWTRPLRSSGAPTQRAQSAS